jgi:hypothetical protein
MDFVDFNLAKKLKEKGFPQHWSDQHYILDNEYEDDFFEVGAKYPVEVIYDYIPTIAAPTISQVLKWFREEKKIHIGFGYSPRKKWRYVVMYMDDRFYNKPTLTIDSFIKIEQAAIAGIEYVLDNLI